MVYTAVSLTEGFESRLSQALEDKGVNVPWLAKATGIADQSIRGYLKGKVPPLDRALAMAEALEVSIDWLASGKFSLAKIDSSVEGPTVSVPRLNVSLAAGDGGTASEEVEEYIEYDRRKLMDELGTVEGLAEVQVVGDSMFPTLTPNQWVLCQAVEGYSVPGIYAIKNSDGLQCKRLQRTNGSMLINSDNEYYAPITLDLDKFYAQFEVVARVRQISRQV